MKKIIFALCCFALGGNVNAQVVEARTDTLDVVVKEEPIGGPHEVITNTFWNNWLVTGDLGLNIFFGEYSGWGKRTLGDFSGRLTPQFNIGVGKWFTPGIGTKLQFGGFRSKGYSAEKNRYTVGEPLTASDGTPYWKSRIKWWDLNLNVMFNLTRLISGYEGVGSDRLKNQLIFSIGIGAVHHWDTKGQKANEWAGHFEWQYSRFFNEKKAVSLDVKLRGVFYEDSFDGIMDKQWDANLSLNVGITYYFKQRGWNNSRNIKNIYTNKNEILRLNKELSQLREENEQLKNASVDSAPETKIVTFPYLVNFVIDKVEIVNRELVNLKTVADMMKATPELKYRLCGYADKYTGSAKRNRWLAEHRAVNVYKVLTKDFGVPAEQLIVDYKGGVDNMYYDDPQMSRSVIISVAE